ncbi:DUF4258 domain-containing protein [Rhizobium quercicola]|uniref:DUF4258 domain-containing protein n=1 Tax=Rhizobium quercicola TaxID=2901226 RepID=UPI003B848D01
MAKPIRYTMHADTVILQRELSKEWIEETVRTPEWTETDPGDLAVRRCFRAIPVRAGRYLRVACVEDEGEFRVVSAFIDRDARKPT